MDPKAHKSAEDAPGWICPLKNALSKDDSLTYAAEKDLVITSTSLYEA